MEYRKLCAAVMLLVLPFAVKSQTLRSVAQWKAMYDANWAKEYAIAKKQSTSNDSWQYYNLAYSIDANTTMFQASGDTKYLDRALEYINDVVKSAVPSSQLANSQFKDSYLGWANFTAPSQKNDGKEYPLFESFCWRYVTTLLNIMHKSPSLLSQQNYKDQYDKLLDFTVKNIYGKWTSRGMSNIYRSNTHMSSHWARIAMDLYEITNDSKYMTIVNNFNKSLKGQIKPNPRDVSAYWWNTKWKNFVTPGQDVAHGNAIVGYMVEAYDDGIAYNQSDINGLINMFNRVIWPSNKQFARYFDGSGVGTGWFSDGLIKLGRYSKSLQLRIEKHNKGRTTQFFGNGALNACILLNSKPVFPENK